MSSSSFNSKPIYVEAFAPTDPGTYAIDTETTRFRVRKMDPNRKTYIEPFGGHELVLGSIAGNGTTAVYRRNDLVAKVAELLSAKVDLVFHNATFDVHTIINYAPELKPAFIDAIRAGRIHDTKILEVLCRIAGGVAGVSADLFKKTSLKDLAHRYAGINLNKSEAIRCDFGKFLDESVHIPQEFLEYAAQDAYATLKIYKPLLKKAKALASPENCRYPVHKNAEEHFGVLGERVEVMGSIGLDWLSKFPVRVDLPAAQKKCAEYEAISKKQQDELITAGYARRQKGGKHAGRFKLSHKKLRHDLAAYAKQHGISPEYTDSGLISLKFDDWSKHIDSKGDGPLALWMRYSRTRKLLTSFLYVYSASDIHYPEYFALGARTTRTATRKFNIQQVPKRRDSLRALFIPTEGRIFIETDYCAAELIALAEVWYQMWGESSHLRDAINAGEDPHASLAKRLFQDEWKKPERHKELRQAAKAVNFGLPGGLGAATFAQFSRGYGLDLDLEEARHLRLRAMSAEPALSSYLNDERSLESRLRLAAQNLGMPWTSFITALRAWRNKETGTYHARAAYKRLRRWARGLDHDRYHLTPKPGFNPAYDLWAHPSRSLTGAVRGGCSYTNAHNMPFQSAVAAAAKMAVFGIWTDWFPGCGWAPVNMIHDSVLIEAHPEVADDAQRIVERNMVSSLKLVCPNVRCTVESERKTTWAK